jgi:hypothetical protein
MAYCRDHFFDDFDCEGEKDLEFKCHKKKCPKNGIVALQAVSLVPQTVTAGAAVPFDTNLVSSGFGIIHLPGGTDFNIVKPGIYRVTFTGSVAPAATTTAGVAIAVNGSIVPGTTVTETVTAGTPAALATQALIQVTPFMNTIITIVNPTTDTEVFTNPNIIIERLG